MLVYAAQSISRSKLRCSRYDEKVRSKLPVVCSATQAIDIVEIASWDEKCSQPLLLASQPGHVRLLAVIQVGSTCLWSSFIAP